MLRLLIRILNPVVWLIDWLSPFKAPPKDIQLPDTGARRSVSDVRAGSAQLYAREASIRYSSYSA